MNLIITMNLKCFVSSVVVVWWSPTYINTFDFFYFFAKLQKKLHIQFVRKISNYSIPNLLELWNKAFTKPLTQMPTSTLCFIKICSQPSQNNIKTTLYTRIGK